ncbi:uncharacterized protein [Halyomorpha halys]|uniref:uncharacterized protein n=1 Tax=Halyomorpha halys TaxID=286706 RepID=UPI0006D4CC18|nr:uncharacterized protein LOC106678979 [Halyomorpha halys]
MKIIIIVACVIVLSNVKTAKCNSILKVAEDFIDGLNIAGKTGVETIKIPSKGLIDASQNVLDSIGETTSAFLHGAAGVTKKGIDAVADTMNIIPFMKRMTNTGRSAANALVDSTNAVGQTLLNSAKKMVDSKANTLRTKTEELANIHKEIIDLASVFSVQELRELFGSSSDSGKKDPKDLDEEIKRIAALAKMVAAVQSVSNQYHLSD